MTQQAIERDTATATEARRRTVAIHDRLAEHGLHIAVTLWDGTRLGPDDHTYRLVLCHPWSLRAMLLPPNDLSAGQAYVRDDIDIEGSMIDAIGHIAELRQGGAPWWTLGRTFTDLLRLPAPPEGATGDGRAARLTGRLHSLMRDREAVQFHYDLGNDFYRLFLDEGLVYSCAYFAPGDDDLDRAQVRKLDLICRKLHLEPGQRLLDIGCGWGALVMHAARYYGVEAVGITLSEQQADLGRERIRAAGLEDRVEIRLADYREVDGTFDAVASVGMVEHVGADALAGYFAKAYELTAPGGRFLNHGITTGKRREPRDLARLRGSFVARYVFPDGALVPASRAAAELEDAGFELIDVEQLRPHYARTLRAWVANLEANRDRAIEVAGEEAYRIWRAYMSGSVIGFESNDLGVVQVLGSRGADLPLGREWMRPQRP